MSSPHCARGPNSCSKCKDAEKNPCICLVQVYLVSGMITRPVGQFPIDGKQSYHEFDVVRSFANDLEARTYARKHPEVQMLLP